MRVGIPNAGQVNALETINIRGERSVTCKGAFDAHPSTGPLPPGAPPECEAFRKQPDALERAAELDAQYGRNPDLATLPMYCVTVSFKDPFDTKDMRSTAGSDVAFAMDAPPFDSAIAARLRDKGAIIYAKAQSNEFNAGPGSPGPVRRPEPRRTMCRGSRRSAPGRVSPATRTTPSGCHAGRAAARAWRSAANLSMIVDLRADGGLVRPSDFPQRHCAHLTTKGWSPTRRHRQPVVLRSGRHSCRKASAITKV